MYARLEILIAICGAAISLALPHLATIARLSSYDRGADGWHTLSAVSCVRRAVLAAVLLGQISFRIRPKGRTISASRSPPWAARKALPHFERAVALKPDFDEARRNLTLAERAERARR